MPIAVAEIEEAADYNRGIAEGLLGAKNACGHAAESVSPENLLSVAELDIVSLVPQADNLTSDAAEPSLLWSWSADYPQEEGFLLEGEDGCPDGTIEFYLPSAAKLREAKLECRYGNSSKVLELGPDGPNPAALELDALQWGDGLRAMAEMKISGKISVTYSYRKRSYVKECHEAGGYVSCGCRERTEFGMSTSERSVTDEETFEVESGQSSVFWLNPPLESRLDGKVDAKALLFARRMPSEISLISAADGRVLGGNKPYRFAKSTGECGEAAVESEFAGLEGGLRVSVANATLEPYQLVEKNASYLPFYLEMGWKETPGRKEVVVQVEDWFLGARNHTREFSVRSPTPYSGENSQEAVRLRPGSQDRTPAAYPSETNSAMPTEMPMVVASVLALAAMAALWEAAGLMKIR